MGCITRAVAFGGLFLFQFLPSNCQAGSILREDLKTVKSVDLEVSVLVNMNPGEKAGLLSSIYKASREILDDSCIMVDSEADSEFYIWIAAVNLETPYGGARLLELRAELRDLVRLKRDETSEVAGGQFRPASTWGKRQLYWWPPGSISEELKREITSDAEYFASRFAGDVEQVRQMKESLP